MRLVLTGAVYYLTTGTRATWASTATNGLYTAAPPGSLAKVGGVMEWQMDVEKNPADTTSLDDYDTQTGAVWDSAVGSTIKSPIKITLKEKDADGGQIAIQQAFYQIGIVVPLLLLNGLSTASGTGVKGIWLDAEILKIGQPRKIKDIVKFDVEVQHSGWSSIPPQWVAIT